MKEYTFFFIYFLQGVGGPMYLLIPFIIFSLEKATHFWLLWRYGCPLVPVSAYHQTFGLLFCILYHKKVICTLNMYFTKNNFINLKRGLTNDTYISLWIKHPVQHPTFYSLVLIPIPLFLLSHLDNILGRFQKNFNKLFLFINLTKHTSIHIPGTT